MLRQCFVAGGAFLLALLPGLRANADTVLQIQPEEVEALVAQDHGDNLLVIHYSSDDGSCSYCIDSNRAFLETSDALGEGYVFAQVIANPWRAYFGQDNPVGAYQNKIGYRLTGVPAAMIFSAGAPVKLVTSIGPEFRTDLEQTYRSVAQQAAVAPGAVSVLQLPSSQIESLVREYSRDRPLVITLSSTDAACSHCIRANDIVDETSRHLADSYNFARIDFDPWQSFSTDELVTDFLATQGTSINGLPTSFLVNKGRILGQMPTLRGDLRSILIQALPGIEN